MNTTIFILIVIVIGGILVAKFVQVTLGPSTLEKVVKEIEDDDSVNWGPHLHCMVCGSTLGDGTDPLHFKYPYLFPPEKVCDICMVPRIPTNLFELSFESSNRPTSDDSDSDYVPGSPSSSDSNAGEIHDLDTVWARIRAPRLRRVRRPTEPDQEPEEPEDPSK